MICPRCKQPKEKEDFYWHTNNCSVTPQQRWKICKKCVSEANKEKLKEKMNIVNTFLFK